MCPLKLDCGQSVDSVLKMKLLNLNQWVNGRLLISQQCKQQLIFRQVLPKLLRQPDIKGLLAETEDLIGEK